MMKGIEDAFEQQRLRIIEVLRKSTRLSRSIIEKEEIRKFLVENVNCIPDTISISEMDKLCNEVDWVKSTGRTILFLQGDYGNVYYIIACGQVGFYVAANKDLEMAIGRELGHLRTQPFIGTSDVLKTLGNNVLTLQRGAGFGEYAILSAANKIRNTAAVTLDDDSLILVLHADTYNEVLRNHIYRRTQFKACISLLQELPIFKRTKLEALTFVVQNVMHQTYPRHEVLALEGSAIKNLLLILSGEVKVFSTRWDQAAMAATGSHKADKRLSKIAISILGRGQLIGESEVLQDCSSCSFEFTYESASASAEVLAIPRKVFMKALNLQGIRNTAMYKDIEATHGMMQIRLFERADRAYEAMKSVSLSSSSSDELTPALPTVMMHKPRRIPSIRLLSSHKSLLHSLEALPRIDRKPTPSRPRTAPVLSRSPTPLKKSPFS